MTPFKKSIILMACLSAYFTPLYALTVSNNAAQVETQGPAAAPAQTPAQTQPMTPGDATNPNNSPTGGEAPYLTSPALSGPPSVATPVENNHEQNAAPKSAGGRGQENMPTNSRMPSNMQTAPQGMMPPGMQPPSGGMPGGASQNMQNPSQGMQGAPQGMQGVSQNMPSPGMQTSPQGMPAPTQNMRGGPQGMQAPPQGVPGVIPQGMQAPPQGMQGAPQGMQAPPQGVPNSQLQQ